jgi:hypothetical protein
MNHHKVTFIIIFMGTCVFSKVFLESPSTDEMFPKFLTLIIYIFSTKLQPSNESADPCNNKQVLVSHAFH